MALSPSSKGLLLDTHILLWLVAGDIRLAKSPNQLKAIETYAKSQLVYCSAISFWEISCLAAKRRIESTFSHLSFTENIPKKTGIQVLPLSLEIMHESCFLPEGVHKDPADRMIIATARLAHLNLVTKDEQILKYSELGHVKVLD